METFFKLLFLLFSIIDSISASASADSKSNSNDQKYKESLFIYPSADQNEKKSERDIPVCPMSTTTSSSAFHGNNINNGGAEISRNSEAVCNLVEKRFFYPLVITRICRCPDRMDCPWEFSPITTIRKPNLLRKKISDPYTQLVNNRVQMKFCNEIQTLPKCTGDMTLSLKVLGNVPSATIPCVCPILRKWILISTNKTLDEEHGLIQTNYEYRCDKLSRCKSSQFCGYITSNYASFYKCTCPQNHLCMPNETLRPAEGEIEKISELFYEGEGTRAYCLGT